MNASTNICLQDIIALRTSDQGWVDMLCKNKTTLSVHGDYGPDIHDFFKSIDFNDVRRNTLLGWECIYCGLGHFVMMRKEYYPRFQQLTSGMGRRGLLWSEAFNVLVGILEGETKQ